MSSNFVHTSQPVFMVDSGGGHPKQHRYYQQQVPRHPEHVPRHPEHVPRHTQPPLVPCWTFPPAREEMKKRSWGRLNGGFVWVVTLLLLLVFAALALGAYQILNLQSEVERLTQGPAQMQSVAPQKQVGLDPAELNNNKRKFAAHLIGRAEQGSGSGTLMWETKHNDVFIEGFTYSNGRLQVNESGLYFVYSRVEFLSPTCKSVDYHNHKMIRQREGSTKVIMEDHQQGLCTPESKDPWIMGSHLGSLQHLSKSDWLFVNVSSRHVLSTNFHHNYFGLFKIH